MNETIWHLKLGHPAPLVLRKVLSSLHLQYDNNHVNFCDACKMGKMHQLPFHHSSFKAAGPLDLIFTDVWGPSPMLSVEGFQILCGIC
jgi:hypothetical protein